MDGKHNTVVQHMWQQGRGEYAEMNILLFSILTAWGVLIGLIFGHPQICSGILPYFFVLTMLSSVPSFYIFFTLIHG